MVGGDGNHSDGYQIGTFGVTTGTLTIRGNYIDLDNPNVGVTDILWANETGGGGPTVIIENNFFQPWGYRTLRCIGGWDCVIRNNVYSQVFKDSWFPSRPDHSVAEFDYLTAPISSYECNRYEDGTFIEQEKISGNVTRVITGCPSYR